MELLSKLPISPEPSCMTMLRKISTGSCCSPSGSSDAIFGIWTGQDYEALAKELQRLGRKLLDMRRTSKLRTRQEPKLGTCPESKLGHSGGHHTSPSLCGRLISLASQAWILGASQAWHSCAFVKRYSHLLAWPPLYHVYSLIPCNQTA